jgi:predicted transposase/invertase (TIGR01784 family)
MIIEIDPRVDIVFHNLFGSPEHPLLTMSLVNSLLGRVHLPKAVELTVENPFQFALYAGQKESELDILYRDENNRQVQLEMQVQYHKGLNQRMLHNWTQLYQRQLGEGKQYFEHRPAISVWILDETLFSDGCWLHLFHCRDDETGLVLHEDLCIITIELPTWQHWLNEDKESILEPLNRWLYFLTRAAGSEEEALLRLLEGPEFKEAVNVIEGYTKEQKRRHAYDMRENYKRLVQAYVSTGYDKGVEKGREETNLENARKMRAKGMSDADIIDITGLTPEDLAGL